MPYRYICHFSYSPKSEGCFYAKLRRHILCHGCARPRVGGLTCRPITMTTFVYWLCKPLCGAWTGLILITIPVRIDLTGIRSSSLEVQGDYTEQRKFFINRRHCRQPLRSSRRSFTYYVVRTRYANWLRWWTDIFCGWSLSRWSGSAWIQTDLWTIGFVDLNGGQVNTAERHMQGMTPY